MEVGEMIWIRPKRVIRIVGVAASRQSAAIWLPDQIVVPKWHDELHIRWVERRSP
jgi:hypothetical protein